MLVVKAQIVNICLKIFENFVGKHNPCDDLPADIASCAENINKVMASVAEDQCEKFAYNGLYDADKFECDKDVWGEKMCINLENLNETVKSMSEKYKNDRNDDMFDDALVVTTMDCADGNAFAKIPCSESAKFAGKFGKAAADIETPIETPKKTCCSCCCCRK